MKNDNIKFNKHGFKFYISTFPYLCNYPFTLLLILPVLLIQVSYICSIPFLFKWLFDDALIQEDMVYIIILIAALGLLFISNSIACIIENIVCAKLSIKISRILHIDLLKKIQSLPLEQIKKFDEADLLGCFSNDNIMIENVINSTMWSMLKSIMIALVGFALLFYIEWILTVITILIAPFVVALTLYYSNKANQALSEKGEQMSKITSIAHESIIMQFVIRIFRLQKYRLNLMDKVSNERYKPATRFSILNLLSSTSAVIGVHFITLMVFCIGVVLLTYDLIDLGSLIAFMTLLFNVMGSIKSFLESYPSLNQANISLNHIKTVLTIPTIEKEGPSLIKLAELNDRIIFKDVEYHYLDRKNILLNINLHIKVGESVAIVGPSGSGKSTLLNLLLAQYQPSKGDVYFDDMNIKLLKPSSILNMIGVVLQDTMLFNTSVYNNILMGKLSATESEIIAAAKISEIHDDIIEFEHGYQTIIGERGKELSVGQRQRIAIARMLIQNPKIICLDEITSSLDPISASQINHVINKISQDRTTITITHRLRTVTDMSKIFVMNNGSLIESGNHNELLEKEGFYFKLWQKQTGIVVSDDGRQASIDPIRLRLIPIFSILDYNILQKLATFFSIERYKENSLIFEEGEYGDKFYIIAAGRVSVTRKLSKNLTKKIATLEDGDIFGEIALINDTKRTATVRTDTNCVLMVLYYQQFHEIYNKIPQHLREQIYAIANKRIELL